MANPEHVAVVKAGEAAIRAWREQHPYESLDLCDADLRGVHLQGADLQGAKLQGASLFHAKLQHANLSHANLSHAILQGASLYEANLQGASLYEANLHSANLRNIQKAHKAYFLKTVQFRRIDTMARQQLPDALYFETCELPWPERWLDWERLRVVGRLPLFGASYAALILIPIIFYGLALYNDQVALVRAWAEQIIVEPDHILHRLASLVLTRFHPRPIPQQSLLLLVSTILLAMGSTLYTFFCPSRIKEFSRGQWCDQLGHALLHYWPLAWRYRYIRLVCATYYTLGGAGALWVIGTKVWRVLLFILKYSTVPWPWR
jgi:Pentapeptide repeats (8 copies)